MKVFFIYLLSIAALFSLFPKEGDINLQWEEREGYTYQIELRRDNVPLFMEWLTESRITLDLAPGNYTYRISFLNKFEKIDAQSDWIELTILKDLKPVIISVPEHTLFARDKIQRIVILTADIMENAQIELEKDGESTILDYKKTGNNDLELVLETADLSPGVYDLRITNPSGSFTLAEKSIRLKQKKNPLVTAMTPHSALLGEQLPHVRVEGEFFDEDIVAFLQGEGRRYRLPVSSWVSEREMDLWLDLTDMEAGRYDLVLINPPLEETVLTESFTIIDPGKIRDESFYENIPWGTDLLIAFPLLDVLAEQPITNFTFVDGEGFFGFFPEIEGVLRFDLAKDRIPARYMGFTMKLGIYPPNDMGVTFTTVSMGLYGRTRFTLPVNLFAEAQLGYRWMNFDEGEESIHVNGALMTWGGGAILNFDRILFETSIRRDFWLLSGKDEGEVNLTQISLRLGYRF